MVITPATLQAAFLAFDTKFQEVYGNTPSFWSQYATRVPSMTKEQRHAWMKKLPAMREWLGERVVNNLSTNLQALVNKKFELTFGIEREDFEDDVIGVYNPSVEMMAQQARMLPDYQTVTALEAGQSNAVYDGVNFFSASHPVNADDPASATQSNYSSSGLALSAANYGTVRAAMRALKGEDGKPLNINPTHLIVPTALEDTARVILQSTYFTAAAAFAGVNTTGPSENIYKGTAQVLTLPLLSSSTRWYLADLSKPIKPMIWQDRVAPEFTYMNKPDDSNVFMIDKFIFGTRARGAAGYGPWQLIYSAQS